MQDFPLQVLSWFSPSTLHLLIIASIYILVWHKCVHGGFLIDDDAGIAQFSDRWRAEHKTLPNGKMVAIGSPDYDKVQGEHVHELKVDYYNQETGRDKDNKPIITTFKNLCYNKTLGFPAAFMRWHKLQIGKKYAVLAKNKKGHEVYGWIQSPFRHHVWSLLVHAINLFLCYNFLNNLFGPEIAFTSTLLFAVHPVASQAVCWMSGTSYLYCLFFLLLNYNIVQFTGNYYWTIPLTVLCTALSSMTLLVGCFNFGVLYVLGYEWEAFAALIIGALVFLKDGTAVVGYRRQEFKKQNMEKTITPNIRKPIVMLKTLWYYICLVTVPKSLGLYHEFLYHYDRQDEEPSWMFWLGLLSLIGFGAGFWYGNILIKFCVVWFLSFWLIFSNFITANQAVVERYIFIPFLAYAVIFAYLLQPYPELMWLLIGLYAMRSVMHVWTFKDQISFYQSNILNFPKSEVAYGNLGGAYQFSGKSGAAFDTWTEATKINPYYDVPWYNMHALLKSQGDLERAKECLLKCMDAKVVHFEEAWAKDMAELDNAILKKKAFEALNDEMSLAINEGKTDQVEIIKEKMDRLMRPTTTVKLAKPE